ncbi:YjfB family protein [Pelagibacterium montanilacus]|uniref:YjfB family protein n=1 Tax=Pelagibacterium montanilacus TaxID=2185280 RepID=UPI000F8EC7BD|nr:YjfB family protein [Pelagibacterium montanilacus]
MSELAGVAVAMKQAQTQNTAQILMTKKAHEMDMAMIDMLTQAVEAAKPPAPQGMGLVLDKSA